MEPIEIKQFCERLQTRNYSNHTVENYGRDLRLFFADVGINLRARSRGAMWITSSNNSPALGWRRQRSTGDSMPSSISLIIWSLIVRIY